MLKNKFQISNFTFQFSSICKTVVCCLLFAAFCLLAAGCRYDMQDQPRGKSYGKSDFFANQMDSRPLVENTVPRGYLREDKALYTGKKDNAGTLSSANNVAVPASSTGTANATYPDAVTEFPLPVTQELLNRGEERYKVFCIVCHGPNGAGDGMIARRGFQGVKSYHTDELRNAPVGHFYDVITNGWGRMNGYAAQIPVYDRWAIVAYVRALQASENPDVVNPNATRQNQTATANQTQKQSEGNTPQNNMTARSGK
jgi:mono/diheme cytochrome c family protein